ncbi:hypothetical protein [Clostridium tagluense]|uniref:hypothetical protein n=1 Tax=Clostridium tagluense TaxID=360422 RepID=UPI001C0BAB27|nr:hypothetical protein [Clostridium tagluense]MBU3130619.1 hypothetical protein [Clostridium tagluense]
MPIFFKNETFQKAKEMLAARKNFGANKAKEIYLLSGLIFCVGGCGVAMQG